MNIHSLTKSTPRLIVYENLSGMNIAFIQLDLENSIEYLAGWACFKLSHLECFDKLATQKKNK